MADRRRRQAWAGQCGRWRPAGARVRAGARRLRRHRPPAVLVRVVWPMQIAARHRRCGCVDRADWPLDEEHAAQPAVRWVARQVRRIAELLWASVAAGVAPVRSRLLPRRLARREIWDHRVEVRPPVRTHPAARRRAAWRLEVVVATPPLWPLREQRQTRSSPKPNSPNPGAKRDRSGEGGRVPPPCVFPRRTTAHVAGRRGPETTRWLALARTWVSARVPFAFFHWAADRAFRTGAGIDAGRYRVTRRDRGRALLHDLGSVACESHSAFRVPIRGSARVMLPANPGKDMAAAPVILNLTADIRRRLALYKRWPADLSCLPGRRRHRVR